MFRLLALAVASVCGCVAASAEAPAAPGPAPAPVKILTWNIQYGSDRGADPNGWPERRGPLRAALESEKPEVLCVQEALAAQLEFLDRCLPGHAREGVGRDDGKAKGEHCAVYWDRARFERLDGGTFWLSEAPAAPGRAWGEEYNRVCTWVRLKEKASGRALRVGNTHFPLVPEAREKAARLVVERLKGGAAAEPLILAGDFNSGPDSPVWKAFAEAGLVNTEKSAGKEPGTATFHKMGIGLVCLDAVFASDAWKVREHRVTSGVLKGVYPSDHFGVAAVLDWKEPPKTAPAGKEDPPSPRKPPDS
jgi:endonuclease/exonuclease/phosphatase family metal-dependent hydrolase